MALVSLGCALAAHETRTARVAGWALRTAGALTVVDTGVSLGLALNRPATPRAGEESTGSVWTHA